MHADWRTYFHESTADWFEAAVGEPTAVQRAGWPAIAQGGPVLISAPTGTGKTLTAFLMLIDRLNALARAGKLEERVYAVYISPLKALGNDIRENLTRPIEGLGAPLRVAVRNGDTPSSERQKMLRHPPHILITTPESIYLLLTTANGQRMIGTADTVIVDELHAILNSKRGTHLLLSLARLDAISGRPAQRIGLSATIRPLALAADFLGGPDTAVVAPQIEKKTDVRVLAAAPGLDPLPEHSVWPEICRAVYEAAQAGRTVLVFCEGRATAEKVAAGVNALGGEGYARSHHGSVAKEQRLEAERALKAGRLKVLCATSSMELGIDVGEIDLVIQVGCPQRVASAVQRLGRAGHRPGAVSAMRFYPRMKQEMLLAAMTTEAMRRGAIEKLEPPTLCLDILAQHLVSMAAAGDYTVDEALALARTCAPYRGLSRETLEAVLRMLSGDGEHDDDRPVSPRVHYDRIHGTVAGGAYSRMLALASGGTIPDRGMYAVYLEDGVTRLGELEEEFVFEARLGDKFFLGAFAWRIVEITRDRVIVRAASGEGAQSPFWRGDGLGRGYETGALFGELLRGFEEAHHEGRLLRRLTELTGDRDAAETIASYLRQQIEAAGCLATDHTLVQEYFEDQSGEHQMMLHCPYGGRVNQGLAVLLRAAAAARTGGDVRVWYDDDGVLLHVTGDAVPPGLLESLDPDAARDVLRREAPGTAQFTISFRYNMDRALMMGVRSGGRVPLWVQRMRGAEALARASAHPDHPILAETARDVLERAIDAESLTRLLRDIRAGRVRLVERRGGSRPSPMTLSLRRQVEAEMMYDYAPTPEAARAVRLPAEDRPVIRPEEEHLAEAASGVKPPDSAEKLHEKLMIEGDLTAGETDAPFEWMSALLDAGRALYIEPGLWIAAEQETLYDAALREGDGEALRRVLRRCLRYRGAQEVASLSERYDLAGARIAAALEALVREGAVVREDGLFIHAEVYRRAQRLTLTARRRAVETAEPAAYAALLAHWQIDFAGSPRERLAAALRRLYGLYLPVPLWEGAVLPARTSAYREGMIDGLLAAGEAVWRLSEDGAKLAFFPADRVDWDAEPPAHDPSDEAAQTRALLLRRGASFTYALAAALHGIPVRDVLKRMALAGDAVCDSLAPLRTTPASSSAKRRVRARLAQTDGGRWELARPMLGEDLSARLDRAFDRWGVVCRETAAAEGLTFSEALTLLRRMEYTGEARRGYFVRTLSGAQFVRAADFDRISERLRRPEADCVCLCAADPAQAWGRVLPLDRSGEEAFLCVPGTAVVLEAGRVALVAERQGAVLRAPQGSEAAVLALAAAFRAGKIYPRLRILTVKEYPAALAPWLEKAGFIREMRDYVLTADR
ncbi:MAG: DEAD/DEAH box helicase [Clostridia bacterium]|nr:DEAD/DEAH box helicase [Clostridia bacterium]